MSDVTLTPMALEIADAYRMGAEAERTRCIKIATDFANGFKVGTPEGDISYAAAMAVAKLIEGKT